MKEKRVRTPPPEGARKASWSILLEWERGDEALEAIRDGMFAGTNLARRDRALVTELTQGVVRHRLFLEHNVRCRLDRPDSALPEPVRQALFLGAYQLLFLDRIPVHAAVKETVQIIKESRFRAFSSLVNAVLRRIAGAGACSVPSLETDPLKNLQLTTSSPLWLVESLVNQEGFETARELLEALNRPPPLTLRANTLRTTREVLLEKLESSGVRALPGHLSETAIILRDRPSPWELMPLSAGYCVVQDEGAQLIAPLLSIGPDQTILDMCAAPGGKTGHIAQLAENRAFVVAADRNPTRVHMMIQGLRKPGYTCIQYLIADLSQDGSPFLSETFDRILLDAPCSGTGVLRRHPEGKWKKDLNTIRDIEAIQLALLESASALLRPGGFLLYTTCSVLREENEDLVERHLSCSARLRRLDMRKVHPQLPADVLTSKGDLRLWPHIHDCDGFFACLMEKRE